MEEIELTREMNNQKRKGQVALTTVFLIGGFIVFMALTLAFLSVSIVASNQVVQASNRALSAATAGVQDGVLRLIRNSSSSGNFSLNVNGDIATVSITNTSATDGQAIIIASSTVNSSQKSVQATISIVSSTGQVSVVSMQQI